MLIDLTYFEGELAIAQLSQDAVIAKVNYFINKYENVVLDKLLGIDLRVAFLAGLAEPIPLQKWLDLRDGKVYEVDNKKREWLGFQNAKKLSLIANYVYYHYGVDLATTATGSGFAVPENENALKDLKYIKLSRAWNELVDYSHSLFDFLEANKADYDWDYLADREFEKINAFNL